MIGNLLLVLGVSLVAGGRRRARPLLELRRAGAASRSRRLLFLIPSVPGWEGDPDRHDLAVLSVPVSIALLLVYVVVTIYSLRRHRMLHVASERTSRRGRSALRWPYSGIATVATALVAEILVGSLEVFAEQVGLSDFFVAAVIVAIVGNAAEHGGAVVVAYRGKIKLAAEIALSSAAQVAVFLIPAVALLSWLPSSSRWRSRSVRSRSQRSLGRSCSRRSCSGTAARRGCAASRCWPRMRRRLAFYWPASEASAESTERGRVPRAGYVAK